MRTRSQKAKSNSDLQAVIKATEKLWRRHHLTYDQTHHVAKEVRRTLEIERPQGRVRVIERLSREEERRLINTAYRVPGTRGLLIKTLFQTGTRVSEFVNIQVEDVYFEADVHPSSHGLSPRLFVSYGLFADGFVVTTFCHFFLCFWIFPLLS